MVQKFKGLISPVVAVGIVSTFALPGSAVFGTNEKAESAKKKEAPGKKEDKSGGNELSLGDILAISDTVGKNPTDDKKGESSEEEKISQENIRSLRDIYMLKALKKAAEDKPKPKSFIGKTAEEAEDLGKVFVKHGKSVACGIVVTTTVVLGAGVVLAKLLASPILSFISNKDNIEWYYRWDPDKGKKYMEYKAAEYGHEIDKKHETWYMINRLVATPFEAIGRGIASVLSVFKTGK